MRTGDRMKRRRFRALLLTALLSVCLYAPAGTAEEARDDVALVLAQNAVENLGLKDAAGEPLVPREAPMHAIHLENLLTLAKLGVKIVPAAPGFYHRPRTIDDLVNMLVGKICDQLGLDADLFPRWEG